MMFSLLLQLLTGCFTKAPAGPGTSAALQYPVLLFNERGFHERMDEGKLTTTNLAVGLQYPEYTILDSGGAQYAVRKVTEFDNRSGFLNMGTTAYRVFLDLKSKGKPSLAEAKSTLKAIAMQLEEVQNKKLAAAELDGAKSFRELVEMCGQPWQWR